MAKQLTALESGMRRDEDKLIQALLEDGINLESLSPAEFEVVSKVLKEARDQGDSTTLNKLYDVDYIRKPPTIQEFLEDDYFMGSICEPDPINGTTGMFPKWRECIMRDMAPGVEVSQMIFAGSIGGGKSFTGSLCVLYKIAHALCLRNPLLYFGLNKATTLTFSFFSVTQAQVKEGTFKDCVSMLGNSPFFRERVAKVKERKFANRRVHLQNNIMIEAGSKVHEALGRNTLVALIDEINFRIEKDAAKAATELVDAIQRRTLSRFQREGKNPGLLVIISSAKTEADFLANYINQQRNTPNARVYDFPIWETSGPTKITYCGDKFKVDIGDNVLPARILVDNDEPLPPERELWVPVEYRLAFEQDLSGSIRDLAGRSVGRVAKFITNLTPLFNSIKDDVINPSPVEEIPISLGVPHVISDFIDRKKFLLRNGTQMVPLRHPMSPRFVHMDMSQGGDAFGFCMLHPTHSTEVGVFNPLTCIRENVIKPSYEVDLLFRFIREKGSKEAMNFGMIREFLWWLKNDCNFQLETVSMDMLQLSHEMRFILNANGIEALYQSVDKTKEPYEGLRQAFMEGRLSTFNHDWLFAELMHLENMPKKIDHPVKFPTIMIGGQPVQGLIGSKDCVAGDTLIPLLDGTSAPIADLVGTQPWVYACQADGRVIAAQASRVWSKGTQPVLRVWLDNNEYLDCTEDHEWMLRDGSFKEARNLRAGDSLMPLYREVSVANSKSGLNGYEKVWCNRVQKWLFTHQVVAEQFNGPIYGASKEGRRVAHHKDFNKRNNCPDNLQVMGWKAHQDLHTMTAETNLKALWERPGFREEAAKRSSAIGKRTGPANLRKYNKDPKRIAEQKSSGHFVRLGKVQMSKNWANPTFVQNHKDRVTGSTNPFARKDVTINRVLETAKGCHGQTELLSKLGCTQKVVYRVLRQAGVPMADVVALYQRPLLRKHNHKIARVEQLGEVEVFDMTVPGPHNFAVGCGVFVHNCADALAGALYTAQKSETPVNLNTANAAGNFFREFAKAIPSNPDNWLVQDLVPTEAVLVVD